METGVNEFWGPLAGDFPERLVFVAPGRSRSFLKVILFSPNTPLLDAKFKYLSYSEIAKKCYELRQPIRAEISEV